MDLDEIEARLVRVASATVERNASLLSSTNPHDGDALIHLGEVLRVFADAGELVIEIKRLRALMHGEGAG